MTHRRPATMDDSAPVEDTVRPCYLIHQRRCETLRAPPPSAMGRLLSVQSVHSAVKVTWARARDRDDQTARPQHDADVGGADQAIAQPERHRRDEMHARHAARVRAAYTGSGFDIIGRSRDRQIARRRRRDAALVPDPELGERSVDEDGEPQHGRGDDKERGRDALGVVEAGGDGVEDGERIVCVDAERIACRELIGLVAKLVCEGGAGHDRRDAEPADDLQADAD